MVNLTTVSAVKDMLHITNDADDSLLGTLVTQASQDFSTEARRQFYAQPGATLTYDLQYPQVVNNKVFFLTDMLGVDRIINGNGSVIPPSTFRLLPLNASPKYAAQLLLGSNEMFVQGNNLWQGAVIVQGTTGFCPTGEAPSDVTLAVTKLAAWYYQTRDNNGDVVRFADGSSQIPANAPAMVLRTVNNYKRVQIYT